jgi:signal transduction histidine kinase
MSQEESALIGRLAAGVVHELSNPVNCLATNFASLREMFTDLAQMVRMYRGAIGGENAPEGCAAEIERIRKGEAELQIDAILDDVPALFAETQRGFDRIGRMIRGMRDFCCDGSGDPVDDFMRFDINLAVENILAVAVNTYRYCAEVHPILGAVPEIACRPAQIHQVLLHLVLNGVQAIETQQRSDKGKIMVRTWRDENCVCLQVADDGPGIAPEIRGRVFEPYFTTNPQGKGIGLGLSLCRHIVVDTHRGDLWFDCPASGGTVFTARIPINRS